MSEDDPPYQDWQPLSDRWPNGLPIYFDRQGQPMTRQQYEDTFAPENYESARRVGQDILIVDGEPCNVSTVWIGIDMGFIRGPGWLPIIFETMVFGGPYDEACMRYATELAAQEGHMRAVANLAAGQQPWFEHDEEGAENGTAQQD